MNKITLYSTGCPKCTMIETIMKKKNLNYVLEKREEEILRVADEHNIRSAPFADIDGIFYTTKQLQEFLIQKN